MSFEFVGQGVGGQVLQFLTPTLLSREGVSGLLAAYSVACIGRVLQIDPLSPPERIQQEIMHGVVFRDPSDVAAVASDMAEFVKTSLFGCLVSLGKELGSGVNSFLAGLLKRKAPELLESLYVQRPVVERAIPRKIARLRAELEATGLSALSETGRAKVSRLVGEFETLLERVQSDGLSEIEWTHAWKLELRTDLLATFVCDVASTQQLVEYYLMEPYIEGTVVREFLVHPRSPLRLDEQTRRNSVFLMSMNFQRTHVLAEYDLALLPGSESKESLFGFAKLISINSELRPLLQQLSREVLEGQRPYALMFTMASLVKEGLRTHWIAAAVVRVKTEEGDGWTLKLLLADEMNGQDQFDSFVDVKGSPEFVTSILWNDCIECVLDEAGDASDCMDADTDEDS